LPILIEEIFLLKTNPEVRVVLDGGASVGGMCCAIREHDFAQDDIGVLAARIRIQSNGFQYAIRAFAFGLHGGASVKTPQGQIRQGGRMVERLDRGLATQLRNRRFAVKPNIFQFVFCHGLLVDLLNFNEN
jgi:hypothetical protein